MSYSGNNSNLWQRLVKSHDKQLDIHIYSQPHSTYLIFHHRTGGNQNTHNGTHTVEQVVKSVETALCYLAH